MIANVIIPSEGGDACVIGEYAVKVGDRVQMGDLLCSVETDKTEIDVSAPCSGTVLAILCEEGSEVGANAVIALVGDEGDDVDAAIAALKGSGEADTQGDAADAQTETEDAGKSPEPVSLKADAATPGHDFVMASPRAKKYAKDHGISLSESNIRGSGYAGSIIERDVMEFIAAREAVKKAAEIGNYHVRELTRIQQITGRRMQESLNTAPQLTLVRRMKVDSLLNLHAMLKEKGELLGLGRITIGDLFNYAVTKTLMEMPFMNARWEGEELREYSEVNLGIAVATSQGLVVPVLHQANLLSLSPMASRSRELIEKARNHSLSPAEMAGGTFTVTNLGGKGIEEFTPILNIPQIAILGIGAPVSRLVLQDGKVSEKHEVKVSLTIDHRALDGAPAADFLERLSANTENMGLLFTK